MVGLIYIATELETFIILTYGTETEGLMFG